MQGYGPENSPGQAAADLQRQLLEIEQLSSATLRARLAYAHPMHVARLAGFGFLALTIISVALLFGILLAPFASTEAALLLRDLDATLPVPTPLLALGLAVSMGIAWVAAGQAVLSMAYDCPLLPLEQQRYDKLRYELDVLSQSAVIGDAVPATPGFAMPQSSFGRAGTPATHPEPMARYATPAQSMTGTLRYPTAPDPFLPIGKRTATPAPAPRGYNTPIPTGGRGLSYGDPVDYQEAVTVYGTPNPAPSTSGSYPRGTAPGAPDRYVVGPGLDSDVYEDGAAAAASWRAPKWGHVEEPWLLDAIQKCEELARRYPVQAFIEYSVEQDLPFTLILERATPAMAVRAMVEFVGFLATIVTPKRARIELRSVAHLDRSFYRSVMSAMEPYFPDTVDIEQNGFRVEITFLEPDRCWSRVPMLPLA